MDYSQYYLEALSEIKLAHDAFVKRDFAVAHDHCLNAQIEMRLLSASVRTWIPVEE